MPSSLKNYRSEMSCVRRNLQRKASAWKPGGARVGNSSQIWVSPSAHQAGKRDKVDKGGKHSKDRKGEAQKKSKKDKKEQKEKKDKKDKGKKHGDLKEARAISAKERKRKRVPTAQAGPANKANRIDTSAASARGKMMRSTSFCLSVSMRPLDYCAACRISVPLCVAILKTLLMAPQRSFFESWWD